MAPSASARVPSIDPHDHLRRVDPKLAAVIDRVGACPLVERASEPYDAHACFEALVRSIVSQQLSTKAAATIFGRVASLGGDRFPGAETLLSTPTPSLRALGLSDAKQRAVRDLALHVVERRLALDTLGTLDDDAIVESLVAVRGIGRWTAEMFMMFRLGRLDVLSTADLGLRKGMKSLYRLRDLPSPTVMEKRSAPWRPFRTVGCWYLWRVAEADASSPKALRTPSSSRSSGAPASRARSASKAKPER